MRLSLSFCLVLAPCAAAAAGFTVASPSFPSGGTLATAQVNARASCGTGGNRSPALLWNAPPPGTRSLAVTLFDPDARGGAGWWHWAAFDLPATLRALPEDAGKPASAPSETAADETREATNDFGDRGYGGPCPPPGDPPHHYVFTLYAVREAKLPFEPGSKAAEVGAWLEHHALARAQVTGRYGR